MRILNRSVRLGGLGGVRRQTRGAGCVRSTGDRRVHTGRRIRGSRRRRVAGVQAGLTSRISCIKCGISAVRHSISRVGSSTCRGAGGGVGGIGGSIGTSRKRRIHATGRHINTAGGSIRTHRVSTSGIRASGTGTSSAGTNASNTGTIASGTSTSTSSISGTGTGTSSISGAGSISGVDTSTSSTSSTRSTGTSSTGTRSTGRTGRTSTIASVTAVQCTALFAGLQIPGMLALRQFELLRHRTIAFRVVRPLKVAGQVHGRVHSVEDSTSNKDKSAVKDVQSPLGLVNDTRPPHGHLNHTVNRTEDDKQA